MCEKFVLVHHVFLPVSINSAGLHVEYTVVPAPNSLGAQMFSIAKMAAHTVWPWQIIFYDNYIYSLKCNLRPMFKIFNQIIS